MAVTHGVHALVWTGGWSPEEARRAIASSAEAGYDLIEIAPIDPTGFDADMTAQLLQEYGLKVSASLGLSADTDVSSEDPEVVARGRDRLATALGVLRDAGGTTLCGVLYSKLGKHYWQLPHVAGKPFVLVASPWLFWRRSRLPRRSMSPQTTMPTWFSMPLHGEGDDS